MNIGRGLTIPPQLRNQWWRLRHLYTIRDKHGRLVKFKPRQEQRTYYQRRHTRNHTGKARQLGMSTMEKLLDLDAMLFPSGDPILPPSPDGIRVGHIDYAIDDAKKKLLMVKDAYDNLSNGDIHPDTWKIGELLQRTIPARIGKENIEFANGSGLWIGTSLRGSTVQKLDISELGKIAIFAPIKAEEIRSGAINTAGPDNLINIESTHEGGEAGLHFELLQRAMSNDDAALTPIDFRFHFFPWYTDPAYSLTASDYTLRPKIAAYFERLERLHGLTFTRGQKLWYDRTEAVQRHAMKKEMPTVPGEMFEAIGQFAIYGEEMANLTSAHPPRILDFAAEARFPAFPFYDIGHSDYMAVWLVQPVGGRHFLVLDWWEDSGKSAGQVAEKMREWERKWGKTFPHDYIPHDAAAIRPGESKSFADYLREAGRQPVIVPRISDVWLGIGYVRDVLPHCFFHKTNCDTPREKDGETLPSGVACLKGYHREITPANKHLREMPAHDQFSHSADAFRTFAEAWHQGIIDTHIGTKTRPQARRPNRRRR